MKTNRILVSLVLFSLCAGSASALTTVNVTTNVLVENVPKIGVNIGGTTAYLKRTCVKNFEGKRYRQIHQVKPMTNAVSTNGVTVNGCVSRDIGGPDGNPWFDYVYPGAAFMLLATNPALDGMTGTITSVTAVPYDVWKIGDTNNKAFFVTDPPMPIHDESEWIGFFISADQHLDEGWVGEIHNYWNTGISIVTNDSAPGSYGHCSGLMTNDSKFLPSGVNNTEVTVRFWAKRRAGNPTLTLFTTNIVALSDTWTSYEYTVMGSAKGFQLSGAPGDEVLIDDIFVEDHVSTNTSLYQDEYIEQFKTRNLGVARPAVMMGGWSMSDQLKPHLEIHGFTQAIKKEVGVYSQQAYMRSGASVSVTECLSLGEELGCTPWICISGTVFPEEMNSLIEFIAGPTNTPWGQVRSEGWNHPQPYTETLDEIMIEMGNEAWNMIPPYAMAGYNGQHYWRDCFAVAKSNPWYTNSIKMVAGGNSGTDPDKLLGRATNADYLAIAPYVMHNLSPEELQHFDPTMEFDTPETLKAFFEWRMAMAMYYEETLVRPKFDSTTANNAELAFYEYNYHDTKGNAPSNPRRDFNISLAHGVSMANFGLLSLKTAHVRNQCFFVNSRKSSDAFGAGLWGDTVNMLEGLYRPVAYANAMMNHVRSGNLMETVHSGDNPTFSSYGDFKGDLETNTYDQIYSYAFQDNGTNGIVLFNYDLTSTNEVEIFLKEYVQGNTAERWTLSGDHYADANETYSWVDDVTNTVYTNNPPVVQTNGTSVVTNYIARDTWEVVTREATTNELSEPIEVVSTETRTMPAKVTWSDGPELVAPVYTNEVAFFSGVIISLPPCSEVVLRWTSLGAYPQIQLATNTLSIDEGGSDSMNVQLASSPLGGSVTVEVAYASGDTDVSLNSATSHIFTTNNWDVAWVVGFDVAEDTDTQNSSATFEFSAAGMDVRTLTVTEVENDLGFVLSTNAVSVPEEGTNTFGVQLSMNPGTPRTVTVARTAGDTDLSVTGGSTLEFDSGNWNVDQIVTLSAADDPNTGNDSATIICSSPGMPDNSLTASEEDNDTVILLVTKYFMEVPEGGSTTFGVTLTAIPSENSTVQVVNVSGDTDVSASSGVTMVFGAANWNTTQMVTVVAAEDSDKVNGVATLRCEPLFGSCDAVDVMAIEMDNDGEVTALQDGLNGYTGTKDSYLTSANKGLAERGYIESTRYPVIEWDLSSITSVLNSATLQLTVHGSSMQQPTNFMVDVYGLKRDWLEGDSSSTGVTWTSTTGSTNAAALWEEGGAKGTNDDHGVLLASVEIPVERNNDPYDVLIPLNSDGVAYLQNGIDDPASNHGFVFDVPGKSGRRRCYLREWDVPEQRPKLTLYQSIPAVLTSTSELSVDEGGTDSFTVSLALQPEATVTVSVSRASGDADITVQSGASLTFTTTNWETPQTVTLAAAQDDDWIDDSATILCSALGLVDATVSVTGLDDEVDQTYILPWSETFETNPVHMAGTLGALDAQHGWTATAATVTNTAPQAGSQACEVGEDGQISHLFTNNVTQVNLTLWMKPTVGETSAPIPTDASAVFYVNTNDQVVAYNSTNATVIASPTVSNDWNKIEVSCDFISKVWKLSLNGTELFTNFAFYADTQSDLNELRIVNEDGTAVVDSIALTEADSFDQDDDGIADSWEIEHYGSTNVAPNAMASNGVNTVLQAYIADLNPTNAASRFLISDLSPLTSESVLTWNGVSGRVYSVYWSSNLLDGFVLLSNNVPWTGSVFTDETHNAESKGFYKIEVELEE